MTGLVNFRDFGGYNTTNGKKVKKGIFYRSGSYRDLNEGDREFLRTLNIQNLCDFRENNELDLEEFRETFAKNVHTVSASAHLGTFDDDKKDFFEFTSQSMRNFYSRLVFDNPGYKNMFDVLLQENAVPYLHNCTAGKDRTGLGSALVLLALGVDERTVMEDYMLSMNNIESIIGNEVRRLPEEMDEASLYHKMLGIMIMPSYLQEALNTILQRYGTYEEYFEAEYGLTSNKIELLRAMYTE